MSMFTLVDTCGRPPQIEYLPKDPLGHAHSIPRSGVPKNMFTCAAIDEQETKLVLQAHIFLMKQLNRLQYVVQKHSGEF